MKVGELYISHIYNTWSSLSFFFYFSKIANISSTLASELELIMLHMRI